MAVAYDNSSQGFVGNPSGTFSHTCTGSNLYLFAVTASVVSAVSYAGVSMTLITTYTPLDQSARIYNNAPKFNVVNNLGNILSF